MITIHNLRNTKPSNPYDIVVCRGKSSLGNPFILHNEEDRNKVCDDYEEWLHKQIRENNRAVMGQLDSLLIKYRIYSQLGLFCWCAPKRCHAETIREIVLYLDKHVR